MTHHMNNLWMQVFLTLQFKLNFILRMFRGRIFLNFQYTRGGYFSAFYREDKTYSIIYSNHQNADPKRS